MSERDPAAVRREIAARRRSQAFQMRREGASFDSIASRLGITRQSAQRMVARETRALAAEAGREERRLLHAEALMDLWRALYGPASEGDLAAIDRFLRVEERLARLLGLDLGPGDDGERPVQILVGAGEEVAEGEATSPPRRFRRQQETGAPSDGLVEAREPS